MMSNVSFWDFSHTRSQPLMWQPNHLNKNMHCAFLQNTDMLNLFISYVSYQHFYALYHIDMVKRAVTDVVKVCLSLGTKETWFMFKKDLVLVLVTQRQRRGGTYTISPSSIFMFRTMKRVWCFTVLINAVDVLTHSELLCSFVCCSVHPHNENWVCSLDFLSAWGWVDNDRNDIFG